MPDVHHIFAPSSAHRHLECVGYLIGPEMKDSGGDAAMEGTVCHKLLEYSQYGLDPASFLGQTITEQYYSTGEPARVDEGMLSAVRFFNQIASELMAELGIDPVNSAPERHLVHPDIPEELSGGTSDFSAWSDDTLLVIDLKYGREPVPATSPQLTEYLLLALAHVPAEKRVHIKRFVQVIVQPRISHGEPVDRYEPSVQDVMAVWEKLWRATQLYLAHRHLPESPPELLVVGSHCRRCPRALHCSAITKEMSDAALLSVVPIDTQDEGFINKLVYWSEKEEAIKSFLKAVQQMLASLAEQGYEIPGRKLVASFGHRDWSPSMKEQGDTYILRRLARKLGVKAEEARQISVKSPSQIEKLLREKGEWTKNKEVQSAFQEMVHRPVRGMKLVELSAKGEVITSAMASEFSKALEEYGQT